MGNAPNSTKRCVIATPGHAVTGGPEALHQLADRLNVLPGIEAVVRYIPPRSQAAVRHYQGLYPNAKESTRDISAESVLILPESQNPGDWNGTGCRAKWIWWLSADRRFPIRSYAGWGHLFQSDYAMTKLGNLGFKGLMLTDYIRRPEARPNLPKEDLVAFNGSKSAPMASLISLCFPNLRVIPLHTLTGSQVSDYLWRAKVYVDFGWHPGRDRLPREAALRNCLVLTGRMGSAGSDIDIPIPANYKLSDRASVNAIGEFIIRLLLEYDTRLNDFCEYRAWIRGQEEIFRNEVEVFANSCDSPEASQLCDSEVLGALDREYIELLEVLSTTRAIAHNLAIDAQRLGSTIPVRVKATALLNRLVWRVQRSFS